MSAPVLTRETPHAELLAIFREHADYDLVGSVERARTFIHAGRMLLAPAVRRSSQGSRGEEIELEPEVLERQIEKATIWLRARNAIASPPRELGIDPCWREL